MRCVSRASFFVVNGKHVREIMLVEHMSARTLVNENMSAKSILQDRLRGVQSAPASYHILAVAIVLNVWDNAFREHFGDHGRLLGGGRVVQFRGADAVEMRGGVDASTTATDAPSFAGGLARGNITCIEGSGGCGDFA